MRRDASRFLARAAEHGPRLLTALLIAAIPATGVLVFGWNLTTVLILVWLESLLSLPAIRLRTSAWLRSLREPAATDHDGPSPAERGPLARRLLGMSIVYCVLLGVITLEAPIRATWFGAGGAAWRLDPAGLAWGAGWIALGLACEGVIDHRTRAARRPDWIVAMLDARLTGLAMLVLILVGYTAVPGPDRTEFLVDHPTAALGLILGFKFLIDLAPVLMPLSPAKSSATPRR
jgi:hypothetical protein